MSLLPALTTAPLLLIAIGIGAYLLGSIPFGVVITRAMGLGDVRKIGSGNIGATNVLRTGRKDLALATLLLDGGKGCRRWPSCAMWRCRPRRRAATWPCS